MRCTHILHSVTEISTIYPFCQWPWIVALLGTSLFNVLSFTKVHFLLLSQHVFSLKWKFSKLSRNSRTKPLTFATEPYTLSIHQPCLMIPPGFYLCWGSHCHIHLLVYITVNLCNRWAKAVGRAPGWKMTSGTSEECRHSLKGQGLQSKEQRYNWHWTSGLWPGFLSLYPQGQDVPMKYIWMGNTPAFP